MKTVTDAEDATGTPEIFTSNTGEIMVESGNPRHIKTVKNLASPKVEVVVCAPPVPWGAGAIRVSAVGSCVAGGPAG